MPSIKDHVAAVNARTDCVRCTMEGSAGDVGATGPQHKGRRLEQDRRCMNRTPTPGLLAPCYRTVKCSQELFHFNHRISFLG